jgi:hypothetical protein
MKKLVFPLSVCLAAIPWAGCIVINVQREAPPPNARFDSRNTTAVGAVEAPRTLNIDFGPGRHDASKQVGPAAAGREGDCWNTVGVAWNNAHTEADLKFASGEPSPIQVEMINWAAVGATAAAWA